MLFISKKKKNCVRQKTERFTYDPVVGRPVGMIVNDDDKYLFTRNAHVGKKYIQNKNERGTIEYYWRKKKKKNRIALF